jgi:ABC-type transport system substrate-binding protein
MRSIELRLFAAISFFSFAGQILLPLPLPAATHPRYGGTLRVELHAASVSLDPREWQVGSLESATNEKMAELVFERLVALDNYGRFQPVLATEWSHDGSNKRWRFAIRGGVKFSDGTALNPEDVVAALQPLLPASEQISAAGNSILIQSNAAMPDLLEQLSSSRYFVYRALASGALAGTGPFVLMEAPAGVAHLLSCQRRCLVRPSVCRCD